MDSQRAPVPILGPWLPGADRQSVSWKAQAWAQRLAMQRDVASGRAWRDICLPAGGDECHEPAEKNAMMGVVP
jgi:hypothetical protein